MRGKFLMGSFCLGKQKVQEVDDGGVAQQCECA